MSLGNNLRGALIASSTPIQCTSALLLVPVSLPCSSLHPLPILSFLLSFFYPLSAFFFSPHPADLLLTTCLPVQSPFPYSSRASLLMSTSIIFPPISLSHSPFTVSPPFCFFLYMCCTDLLTLLASFHCVSLSFTHIREAPSLFVGENKNI